MTKQELWHQPTYISMNNRRRHRPSRPPQPSPDDRRKPSSNSKNNAMKTETEMVYPLDKNAAISAVEDSRSPRPGGFRRQGNGVAIASWSAPVLWRFASGILFNASTFQPFNLETADSNARNGGQ